MRLVRSSPTRPPVGKWYSLAMLVAMFVSLVGTSLGQPLAVSAATVGQSFVLTPADLAFILKQIKIAEHHAATATPANPCSTLVGPGPDQIPDYLTSYGLRTVDGSCNNLIPGREKFGTADLTFPRLTSQSFRPAEAITPSFPVGPPGPTSYAQTSGSVIDSQPRMISNLIVDQSASNPAAVAAAGFPVRSQGNTGIFPCGIAVGTPPVIHTNVAPDSCVDPSKTLFIPNVTTDVGLSPPYNSLFTIFGQFFDHGLDKVTNGGNGTVFVPLHADDPLITVGPDGIAGTNCGTPAAQNCDEVPPGQQFMVLTRATNVAGPGPDGILGTADDTAHEALNTDSPWVDLSQDYTSHPSHQVFLREYAFDANHHPQSTGRIFGSADGTMARWSGIKLQAANLLGLRLVDTDVNNIPMLATDPYGNFIPGPNGLPQYVTTNGLVEGNLANPVPVPVNGLHIDTAFLNDIAHSAVPTPGGPDADSVAGLQLDTPLPIGTYDDELLDLHVIAGDGRANENIGLTAIHTVFEHEHNRLVGYIEGVLSGDTSVTGIAALAEWKTATSADGWNGSRIFQAARFATEMQYQHLVFEEFGRKIQPAIQPFHLYQSDINPAVTAEFAHAVYRLGHSMLDDDLPRINADGTHNDLPLLDAFLNPAQFTNGGTAGVLNGDQATGAIIMGLSDQTGNELDEFIANTLRNNLLGLPLDLASLNLTRARSEGIPSLNNVRKQINAATNDGQLIPYNNWVDFGQNLKHPESLINFIAAYGTHPSIVAETTMAGKRNAARAIVDPIPNVDVQPTDAADFMFSTGAWANTLDNATAVGTSTTGLDDVDLWVGGLAEKTNLFGGLLGSTFNYVFEKQLTDLQNGDRLYYLARTPGLNLRTQLEGNSFAELVMRNTDAHTLKADAFATADCKFELANLNGTAAGFAQFGPTVADDPASDCPEQLVLQRDPNGTIRYKALNSIDPPGINGQAVYNGTASVDRITGGNDNDTIWGGPDNDVIEGNGGDDIVLGGEGNDIITDSSGADVPKGGPGNDAIDGGIGDDIPMGGPGQDFINGGANDNETFAGPGNDFIIAGQGADAVFGDSGDDWIQGGSGQDLLQGDHGAPFFDDPGQTAPGNDIFIGQVGENDYDAEGGDDVMAQNAAIDRNAGAGGFDWAFHQYNTVAADDDMNINQMLVGLPIQLVVNRDRWQETEADSGSKLNDTIRGDDLVPAANGGAGFSGCDALDAAGVARIAGLSALITPAMLTVDPAPIAASAAAGQCPLTGNVWGAGNILLGGGGSDSLEGRGADDIIDGDRSLRVRISVRAGVDADGNPAGGEIGSTDLMENRATSGSFGTGTTNMTLQQAVFAGLVNPGQLVGVREIGTTDVLPSDIDTAVFSGPRANYTIIANADGSVTVTDVSAAAVDGVDTLWNIEQLSFCNTPGAVRGTCAVARTIVRIAPTVTVTPTSLTFANQFINTTSAVQAIIVSNTGFTRLTVSGITVTGADAASFTTTNSCTNVAPGGSCTISVRFAPTSVGAKTAAISIASNDPTSPKVVPVIGTAINTVIGLNPNPLAFGSQLVGTNSATQAIVVRNTSTARITINALVLGGPNSNQFTILNPGGCPGNLNANATCTINVQFRPTAASGAGNKTATITITSPTGGTAVATVTGTATTQATIGALANVAFGNRPTGSTTTTTLQVTNTGSAPLNISSVSLTGSTTFSASLGTCSAAVAPGASCQLVVSFVPTTNNNVTALLTIISNASNNPRTVTLTGR